MKKIIEEFKPEKCIYYSDLSGKKIAENDNFDVSQLKLVVKTFGHIADDSWWWDRDDLNPPKYIKDNAVEEINLQITYEESAQILKYLRKKYPGNKELKTYLFVK